MAQLLKFQHVLNLRYLSKFQELMVLDIPAIKPLKVSIFHNHNGKCSPAHQPNPRSREGN